MRSHRSRTAAAVMLGALSLPLLATGTCVNIATESAIGGFFDAATLLMVDHLKDELGVSTAGTGTTTSTTTS